MLMLQTGRVGWTHVGELQGCIHFKIGLFLLPQHINLFVCMYVCTSDFSVYSYHTLVCFEVV